MEVRGHTVTSCLYVLMNHWCQVLAPSCFPGSWLFWNSVKLQDMPCGAPHLPWEGRSCLRSPGEALAAHAGGHGGSLEVLSGACRTLLPRMASSPQWIPAVAHQRGLCSSHSVRLLHTGPYHPGQGLGKTCMWAGSGMWAQHIEPLTRLSKRSIS